MIHPPRPLLIIITCLICATIISDYNHWHYASFLLRPVLSFFIAAVAWLASGKNVYQTWITLGLVFAMLGDIIFLLSHNLFMTAAVFWGHFSAI